MEDKAMERQKAVLRTHFKQLRKSIPDGIRISCDNAIYQRLIGMQEYRDARFVLPYLSFGAEVDTRRLIYRAWADGKTVALPRCVEGTHDMEWFVVTSFDDLVRSPFGVDEPRRNPSYQLDVGNVQDALAIVPGLSFDLAGHRIGYGGGFYDTFLSGFAGTSVGLCRECQLIDDLAGLGVIDTHDRAVQLVVTERRVSTSANR